MQDDVVEAAARKFQRLWPEGHHAHRQVLVECAVEVQHGELPGRSVVPDDGLAAKSLRINPTKSSI
jgi:hypothetical protein